MLSLYRAKSHMPVSVVFFPPLIIEIIFRLLNFSLEQNYYDLRAPLVPSH